MEQVVLGVDVGGTAIKTWWATASGGIAGPEVPTPRDDPTGERTADLVARIAAAESPVAVGLAVPGIVDDAAGVCRMSVNLGWREVRIGALVGERIGLRPAVVQDVRAGALAEHRSGAGAGRSGGLLFAPVGTGLALASLDESGRPLATGWAGEVGQLRYRAGPHAGLRVEEVASAGGLAHRYGAVGAREVLQAMQAGDARAAAAWSETVEALAEVLAWAVSVTAPSTVVIGGGLARAGAALLEPLAAALADRLAGFPMSAVVPARHGAVAAAVGAADAAGRPFGAPGAYSPAPSVPSPAR